MSNQQQEIDQKKSQENNSQVSGSLERLVFRAPDTGFSVFTVKIGQQLITVKGVMPDLVQGEIASFKGIWEHHKAFGKQLNVTSYQKTLPVDALGIQKYLSSGMIKGIGPAFAEKLVKAFGSRTLEIIDKEPERLESVPGVGPKRAQSIIDAWEEQREIAAIMVFLRSKDIAPAFAAKIYKTYGQGSIAKITDNPYRLVEDIWGVGFKSADDLALKLGLDPNSIERVKAATLHALTEAMIQGHLAQTPDAVEKKLTELIQFNSQNNHEFYETALQELISAAKLVRHTQTIDGQETTFISLPLCYNTERGIAHKIKWLTEHIPLPAVDTQCVYQDLRNQTSGVELNEDQLRGIMTSLSSKISIITGGPGTGKTTLVKKLLSILDDYRIIYRVAAPTGRAAKRMFENTGKPTATIHRLLDYNPGERGFKHNEQEVLDIQFLIIDEASMIDIFLMYSMLKALPQHVHLLLLGDVDQLPSVGAGSVLNDMIKSGAIPVTRLTQIFRQAQNSMIITNAHRINHGEFPAKKDDPSTSDFFFVKRDEPDDIAQLFERIYKKSLAAKGIKPENAVILTPMNKGAIGTVAINAHMQQLLNPATEESKEISRFGNIYRTGDRVMQIKNNYDKFVFNGDMGIISTIDTTNQKLYINFGDRELEYDFAEIDELVLSYAISIHKSQGSEFEAVIIPIFMQHFMMLQRNLLYTAVTRAKKLCILIGQPRAIGMAVKNNKSIERITFLANYLAG